MSLADRRLLTEYLRLDANRVTMRDRGRIMPVVTSIAVGANEEETFRMEFLRSFARRGLGGVEVVILDAQEEAESRGRPCTARLLAAVLRAFQMQRPRPSA
jgi:transposase-like protein